MFRITQWFGPLKIDAMENLKLFTRDNVPTDELSEIVVKVYKGVHLEYKEVFYLDFDVDENTGMIDKSKKVKFYTKSQASRNLKALKNAYMISKGSAAPDEIIMFRKRYNIAASTLSVILGFSKNTISNIEHDGISSLPTGRLIKICLSDVEVFSEYINSCDVLEEWKKIELSKKVREEYI